jgi:hypothetical protein
MTFHGIAAGYKEGNQSVGANAASTSVHWKFIGG